MDDEAVMEAARIANAHEFIEQLPDGYNTVIGEKGHRLSGGQRQCIALARAIIRNPDIFILDEATSNLDSHSESLIQNALARIRKDHTILTIAHRLSTLKHADCILVLDQGRLIAQGTHEALLDLNDVYTRLWRLQSSSSSPGTLSVSDAT
jgi:ATP-binding cassette subfamily B protein